MIKINGKEFFLDINQLDKFVTVKPEEEYDIHRFEKQTKGEDGSLSVSEVEITKVKNHSTLNQNRYTAISAMVDILFSAESDGDEKLGKAFDKMTVGQKLAYNTLYRYKIITDKIG